MGTHTFSQICKAVRRDAVFVRGLQRSLDLHIPSEEQGYSDAYAVFVKKVIALRALHVPQDVIKDIFETEKKILALLHMDAMNESPTWYLDGCAAGNGRLAPDALLLSGYSLGFPIDAGVVQPTLDFGERKAELFKGQEMGEDVRRVLKRYREQVADIRARVARERPIVEDALAWARTCLR